MPGEIDAVITGIGQSAIGRKMGRSAMSLVTDACLGAIADAGLTVDQIDGISTYPGRGAGYPGLSPLGVPEVQDALGLSVAWFAGGFEITSSLGSILNACAAVTAGLARHVLCFRGVYESSMQGSGSRVDAMRDETPLERQPRLEGFEAWHSPMHCNTMNAYALVAQRYMHEFGVPREDFAQVSLNGRRNAERNEKAVFRTPLTLDDYLSARMISTPLCLFDCDIPIDGATAVIVSHPSAAGEVRKPPLRVAAAGAARTSRVPWDQVDDLTTFANKDAAQQLWSRTDLTPADVDVALLYDGYSIITVSWIEGLGFCGRGEAGQFLRDLNSPSNHRELVVNPHGGHLSEGRTHGYGFIYEAAAQLWGEAGARQVGHDPEVAVATSGGMHGATCLLLTR